MKARSESRCEGFQPNLMLLQLEAFAGNITQEEVFLFYIAEGKIDSAGNIQSIFAFCFGVPPIRDNHGRPINRCEAPKNRKLAIPTTGVTFETSGDYCWQAQEWEDDFCSGRLT